MTQDWKTIDTDFLVVGGGVAGCMAAIPVLEAGHSVVMCEKGKVLDHCGSVGVTPPCQPGFDPDPQGVRVAPGGGIGVPLGLLAEEGGRSAQLTLTTVPEEREGFPVVGIRNVPRTREALPDLRELLGRLNVPATVQ